MVYLLENNVCVPAYVRGRIYSDTKVMHHDPFGRKDKRNARIFAQYSDGITIATLAQLYGLSTQRIHQIIRKDGHSELTSV
jgi:hypothetical protein